MSALPPSDRSSLAVTGWLLTAALIAFRLLPGLAQPGMFFDGVTYATISRNLAIGVGDLAHPSLVPGDAGFYDSPPLVFLLESGFFRALGDHYWVEKIYSALTGIDHGGAHRRDLAAIGRRPRRLAPLELATGRALGGRAGLGMDVLEQHAREHARIVRRAGRVCNTQVDGDVGWNESTLARSASEGERPVTRIPSLARSG